MPNNAADLPNLDLIGNRYQDATVATNLVDGSFTKHREGWANASTSLPRGGQWDDPVNAVDNDVFYLGRLQGRRHVQVLAFDRGL
jgi:hypothetical protein